MCSVCLCFVGNAARAATISRQQQKKKDIFLLSSSHLTQCKSLQYDGLSRAGRSLREDNASNRAEQT